MSAQIDVVRQRRGGVCVGQGIDAQRIPRSEGSRLVVVCERRCGRPTQVSSSPMTLSASGGGDSRDARAMVPLAQAGVRGGLDTIQSQQAWHEASSDPAPPTPKQTWR